MRNQYQKTEFIDVKRFDMHIREFELFADCCKQLFVTVNFLTNDIFYTIIYDDEIKEVFYDYETATNYYNDLM